MNWPENAPGEDAPEAETAERALSVKSAGSVESAERDESAGSVDSIDSAESTEDVQSLENTESGESTERGDRDERGEQALYHGDTGDLSLDARRVLVQLLAGPSLDAQRHSKLWPVLIREEAVVRSRLSELFLQLVIDRDLRVAFTRQADTGELEVPLLLRRAKLTFIDSVLLLHLRQRLTQAEAHGERAVVSIDEILEFLRVYEQAGNTDRALFDKRIHASIEKIKKHSILRKIRASEDRFEISPTLKLLFSAEEIQALTRVFRGMRIPGEDPDRSGNVQVNDAEAGEDEE